MKAKEYFHKLKTENQDKDHMYRIYVAFKDMFLEIEEIKEKRKIKDDSRLIPIFNETNEKANSFIKMINDTEEVKNNGTIINNAFKYFIEQSHPSLAKSVWDNL